MATRSPRLAFATSIFLFLTALAGCGSSHTVVCNLTTGASGGCGCGAPASTACPAPQYLVADGVDGRVYVFPVNLGAGTLGTPTSVDGPSQSLGMALLLNSFVYVSSFSTSEGAVSGWSLGLGTGVLTPVTGSPYSLGPLSLSNGLAAANTPHVVYVADAEKIDAFKADATGTLTAVAGSPFPSGTNLFLAVDPQSKFLFSSEDDPPGKVGAFTIDATTGALTQVAGSPFPVVPAQMTSTVPGSIIVDSSDKFVYVTLTTTGQIAGFSIDASTGALTAIPGSPFTAAAFPFQLATAGNFLYVSANGSILGYSIDASTGALTPLAGSPFAFRATAMTTDLLGTHLYAATPSGIVVFQVDSTTGALTQVGSPAPSAGASVLAFVQ